MPLLPTPIAASPPPHAPSSPAVATPHPSPANNQSKMATEATVSDETDEDCEEYDEEDEDDDDDPNGDDGFADGDEDDPEEGDDLDLGGSSLSGSGFPSSAVPSTTPSIPVSVVAGFGNPSQTPAVCSLPKQAGGREREKVGADLPVEVCRQRPPAKPPVTSPVMAATTMISKGGGAEASLYGNPRVLFPVGFDSPIEMKPYLLPPSKPYDAVSASRPSLLFSFILLLFSPFFSISALMAETNNPPRTKSLTESLASKHMYPNDLILRLR